MRDICLPPLALRSPPLAGEPGSGRARGRGSGSSLKARLVVMCSWRLERFELSAACWGGVRGGEVVGSLRHVRVPAGASLPGHYNEVCVFG